MKTHFLFVALALITPKLFAENEVGFIEKFALAPDREAVLAELLPGSEESYFYQALHYQNTRQVAKYAAVMEQWAKRWPDSAQRRVIENREALLSYDASPEATLKFLRERLNLQFHHTQQVRDRKPDLPTTLDPARISREAFLREALQDVQGLAHLDDAALELLVLDKTPLDPAQRRVLLSRLQRPDLPGLVELIEAELKTQESKGFGEFAIHRALLPPQLDELAKRIPTLLENQAFVFTRLRKLAPSADVDLQFDLVEREAWLERLWNFARNLSPAFNTVKAHILFARLQLDRQRGIYNKEHFIEYLKLPRHLPYVNPSYLQPRGGAPVRIFSSQPISAAAHTQMVAHPVDLNADLKEFLIATPPIAADEWLVREFLIQIFKDEPSWQPYATLLREDWVKAVFAESKMLHGIGNPEQWAALLSATEFQRIKERVELGFAPTNPIFHAPAADVALEVWIKNAPKLIVKIYEINTLSFFLTQNRQLNTDVSLDGLVANVERTYDFSAEPAAANPFRRVPRKFEFPELKDRRGAWIVEFIGGGKSSRVLIRKGQFQLLERTSAAGHVFTVIDEQRQPVADAAVWLEGRRFTADPKSRQITVPFTNQPGVKPLILADAAGGFATLTSFEHLEESYGLNAQFHVSREQLLARREATLAVRAGLVVGTSQIPPGVLLEPKLTLTTVTLDGVSTAQEIGGVTLDPAKAFLHTFTVPERLASLTVTLTAKVEKLSAGGEKIDLNASHSWQVNGIDKTDLTSDGHLSNFNGSYVFELLGKNAEPLADQQVVFEVHHRHYRRHITAALRTDESGRITLGTLEGIASVKARLPNGRERFFPLKEEARTTPAAIHVRAGEPLLIPVGREFFPTRVSLLEIRSGLFAVSRTSEVSNEGAAASGFLQIKALPPGDYSLRVYDPHLREIAIRVTDGQPVQNWLVSPNRSLELRNPPPLQITGIAADAGAIVVRVLNANPLTRVHVAASRFLPEHRVFENLASFIRFEPGQSTPDRRPNLYVAGRAIGDEYRYILERRYAKHFPGNMLTRPGLLLNPWEVRSTDLNEQQVARGEALGRAAGDRERVAQKAKEAVPLLESEPADADAQGPNLDFLATTGPVLYNLTPDKDGVIRIDRKLLGDRQYLEIYAEDIHSAVWKSGALAEAGTKVQDLRLVRNLDPQKHFTQQRQVTILAAGASLTLADILTSEFEAYDSLSSIHALFSALSQDEKLAKFAWILQWPALSAEEKRAKYSEFACHELSFFLSRKDPQFFEQVVQPYLRNKKDKTFLDDYLIGADLQRYLDAWTYGRLNMAKRALLARRLPAEAAATARHLRELYDLLPIDLDRQDHLFDTALRGRGLRLAGEDEFASARKSESRAVAMDFASLNAPAAPASAAPAPAGSMAGRSLAARSRSGIADPRAPSDELKQLAEGDRPELMARMSIATASEGQYWDDFAAAKLEDVKLQRGLVRQFYRALGPTKEWAENNYYHLRITEQLADLIPINAFWRDFAAWDGKAPFLSENVAEASRNFSEMMLALAVLDLPFEAPKHSTKAENGQFTFTAGGAVIVFHKQIKPVTPAAEQPDAPAAPQAELLVSENFFRHGDRFRHEGNEQFDKYVTKEFLAGVVYGANVVVTNPSSSPQKIELLLQIPRGALPVLGSKATDSKRVRLDAYSTRTFEYHFYFPAPAAEPLPHFPVHVARNEQHAGSAKAMTFKVVRQLSEIDTGSWEYVSQYGSEAEVFAFLEKHSIERLNLELVAWRARQSAEFFQKLIALLRQRRVYSEVIYRYAVLHNAAEPLREWLKHRDDFVAQCGPYLETKLIRIDPIERHAYEHLEYSPLVNQRAHRLGAEPRIPNPVLREQYQALLRILAHKPALDAIDQMSVVYYLFLQDRVEEALGRFAAIQPNALPVRLQHDYFRCYAAFYEEKLADARAVAAQHIAHPVDRWRKLFTDVVAQLDEIEGKAPAVAAVQTDRPDREAQQGELASTEPAFDFKVENRTITLTWRNLGEVTVNYYLMDPEFLFSSSPFVSENPGRFSIVKPTLTARQALPEGGDTIEIALPEQFQRANVLVEILGAGQRKAQAYHAHTMRLNVVENYGRLEVREAAGKAIPRAYVKVYARLQNGQVRFFKDGYTDLRGKFDYASLNSSAGAAPPPPQPMPRPAGGDGDQLTHPMLSPGELDQVAKLAILVITETNGTQVREVNPPSQ